jgi:hypothetical protein
MIIYKKLVYGTTTNGNNHLNAISVPTSTSPPLMTVYRPPTLLLPPKWRQQQKQQ